MFLLNRLMEQDQPSMQGAVRSAIWLIGQVPQRSRWADPAHLKGRFLALAGLRLFRLWSPRPRRKTCLASKRQKPVKRFNINMKASRPRFSVCFALLPSLCVPVERIHFR